MIQIRDRDVAWTEQYIAVTWVEPVSQGQHGDPGLCKEIDEQPKNTRNDNRRSFCHQGKFCQPGQRIRAQYKIKLFSLTLRIQEM